MQEIFLLIVGLIGLWAGTEWVVKGAVGVAEHFGLSHLFIGLTILSIGTDLPEMVISINAAIQQVDGVDTSGVIIGNAIGSGMSQLSLVLGIVGLLSFVGFEKKNFFREGIMLLGSVLVLFLVVADYQVTMLEGWLLIVVYLIYYITLVYREKSSGKKKKPFERRLLILFFYLIVGLVAVVLTSKLVVNEATALADIWGVKQSFVGIIILGLGTSLPELAISLTAILKKAKGLSVGNLVGSNIFDTLMPVGVGAAITNLTVDKSVVWIDVPVLFLLSSLVVFFLFRKGGLQRNESIVLISFYFVYMIAKILGA